MHAYKPIYKVARKIRKRRIRFHDGKIFLEAYNPRDGKLLVREISVSQAKLFGAECW